VPPQKRYASDNNPRRLERVDSLLEFKSFFFLKEVQGNALSFLSAVSFLNSARDKNIGHLLSRD
jgi:hypothetical protein